jgi:hypothetical protein
MKSRLKGFDSYVMKFMSYGFLFGEKQTHFFQKSITFSKNKNNVEIN